jgi:hypothetical protein
MTGEEARKRLLAIKPDDDMAVDALADEIERDSRAPLLGLARLQQSGQSGAETAGAVLRALEELAVRAILDTAPRGPARRAGDSVGIASAACNAFADRFTTDLTKLLDNTTRIPVPKSARPVEDPEPPRRLCDEAYLLLRRWQKPEEAALARELNRREFLRLEMAERDAEIDRYRRTKGWTEFAGDAAE